MGKNHVVRAVEVRGGDIDHAVKVLSRATADDMQQAAARLHFTGKPEQRRRKRAKNAWKREKAAAKKARFYDD